MSEIFCGPPWPKQSYHILWKEAFTVRLYQLFFLWTNTSPLAGQQTSSNLGCEDNSHGGSAAWRSRFKTQRQCGHCLCYFLPQFPTTHLITISILFLNGRWLRSSWPRSLEGKRAAVAAIVLSLLSLLPRLSSAREYTAIQIYNSQQIYDSYDFPGFEWSAPTFQKTRPSSS